MKNPVAIEKQYRELLSYISFPISPRERLLRIKEFVDQLMRHPDESESYLLEVLQHLPDIVYKLDIAGIEPYIMRSLYEDLLVLHRYHPSLSDITGFERSIDTIRFMTAQLYAFAGNPRVMLVFLNPNYAEAPPRWMQHLDPDPMVTPYELVRQVDAIAEKNNDTVSYEIDRILEAWTRFRSIPYSTAIVPVVEFSCGSGYMRHNYGGGLRKIRVKVIGETPERFDDIHPDIAVYGARPPVEYSMKLPVLAARNLVARTHPHLMNRYVAGHVQFDNRYAMHEGASANAAIAALTYCTILKTFKQRTTYRISPGVAITGNVNEQGDILPVDQHTLDQKVRAVTFSGIDYLVVPKQQLDQAEHAVSETKEYYPGRRITVIGIGHLHDIFYDRRLTEQEEMSKARFIGRQLRSRKYAVGSVATILLLLIVIALLIIEPSDKNPVYGNFEGESLVLYNQNYQVVDRIPVGPEIIMRDTRMVERYGRAGSFIHIADATGDGTNEVIWVSESSDEEITTSVIYCKSISHNKILWEYPISFNFNFPAKPYVNGNRVSVNYLLIDDFDGTGAPDLVVIGQDYQYFPGFVLRIDLRTGELLGEYVNTGAIVSAFVADITGNGRKEIIAGGNNNAFDEAMLIVLDPQNLKGHSPLRGDYILEGYEPAEEISYIRFPRTVLGEILSHRSRYNRIVGFKNNPGRREFQAYIIDYYNYDPQSAITEVTQSLYIVTFDYDLNVKSIGTDDGYDVMARFLLEQGYIDSIPDRHYFSEYAAALKYWDGKDWQHKER